MTVLGLLLAAGEGRRMGTPKALLRDASGMPFVVRSVGVLRDGGCDEVLVVTGAAADEVAGLLHSGEWLEDAAVASVVAEDWARGMGASLRAGLAAASSGAATCALVGLVDLPDVGPEVLARMLDTAGTGPSTLARATYHGAPGHPVLLGRDHWPGVVESARGDKGARDYLAAHEPLAVECGDLATGRDTDTPDDLAR